MTERAKLYLPRCVYERSHRFPRRGSVAVLLAAAAAVAGCSDPERVFGVYAHDTRELVRLDYDYDGNGTIDVRTYMRKGRPIRLEGDADGDGRIDRWEYYGADGRLLRVGTSTRGDGREDAWVSTSGDERRVELSTAGDGIIDRRETYRGDVLVHAETDANHDGLPDRWEEFEQGRLARLLIDDEQRHGRPTRRIVYGAGGDARIETLTDHETR